MLFLQPAGIATARPPVDGFIIQESSDSIGATDAEVAKEWATDNITDTYKRV